MTTLNKVTLIGYLGRAPEMRSTAAGDPVTQLVLATTETWRDKATGEKKEATEWHRVVLYRKLAEVAAQYLKKGSLIYVEGRLQSRKWTGKDEVERTMIEIIADDMRMLNTRSGAHDGDAEHKAEELAPASTASRSNKAKAAEFEFEDDAIPF